MSLGLRAEANNTSAVISVAGVDQVVINNAGDVAATTFTGALVGNAATATALSTATGVAPVYGARAWVSFDGTKDTTGAVSTANTNRLIRGSGNVSSVLRNGTGDYTINFTAALVDANYAVFGTGKGLSGSDGTCVWIKDSTTPTSSAVTILTGQPGRAGFNVLFLFDNSLNSVLIFR